MSFLDFLFFLPCFAFTLPLLVIIWANSASFIFSGDSPLPALEYFQIFFSFLLFVPTLVSAISVYLLGSKSPVEIYFWLVGKTCLSGLGRHGDDVEYLGNIFGLRIYDFSQRVGVCRGSEYVCFRPTVHVEPHFCKNELVWGEMIGFLLRSA